LGITVEAGNHSLRVVALCAADSRMSIFMAISEKAKRSAAGLSAGGAGQNQGLLSLGIHL
jgi:hypothetical protein